MKAVRRVLAMVGVMVFILIAAFGINKLIQHRKDVKFERERIVRREEVGSKAEEKKEEISQISQLDQDEIKTYIEENAYVEEDEADESGEDDVPIEDPWSTTENFSYYMPSYDETDIERNSSDGTGEIPEDITSDSQTSLGIPVSESLPEHETPATEENAGEVTSQDNGSSDTPTETTATEAGTASEETTAPEASATPEETTAPEASAAPEETTAPEASATPEETTAPEETSTSEETNAPEETATPEETPGEGDDSWSAGSKKENVQRVADLGKEAVEGNLEAVTDDEEESELEGEHKRITLKDRQKFRTSEEETQLWIEADNSILENVEHNYNGLKITCLGDSITEATNIDDLEDYQQYAYPARLGEVLGASEVVNLGIGGSSYGRYWDHAFCERYMEIPDDTDLIIIMGGDNDGYCLTEDLVGSMDDREPRTLYGDVDELMRGLKENYPNAQVVFMTPMPNLLHDVLRKEREELLSQTVVVNCILELAEEYGFDVIDLYNSNFFDSHDAEIVSDYIPDSVHPNEEGYDIFARHVAAELIRLEERKAEEEALSGEDSEENAPEESLTEEGKPEGEETGESEVTEEGENEGDASDEEKYDGSTDDHSYTEKIKDRIQSRFDPEEIEAFEEEKELRIQEESEEDEFTDEETGSEEDPDKENAGNKEDSGDKEDQKKTDRE
ncbi:MAG: hypothetical protein K5888_02285 [Lachnospiraceae bacterium]|nr:hypothetical protein [Lachnospiraceae bacterium]